MNRRELLVVLLTAACAGAGFIWRARWWPKFMAWFNEPSHPFNLAVFRIVLFVILWVTADPHLTQLFGALPNTLVFPADGPFLTLPPQGEAFTMGAWVAFRVVCVMGMLGLFTRFSCLTAAILGAYVIGLPNFFGKTNHAHHLIWFALLLGFSRAGDFLSLDALRLGFVRGDRRELGPVQPEAAYGAPLKAAILLMGLMYFWPAFYKLYNGGPGWVSPDALRALMYEDWRAMGKWLPPIRLDQIPLALFAGGLGTVLFEALFLPLAMMRRTKILAALGGIAFHNMTYLNLGIRFGTLQAMYVVFFDWSKLMHALGKRLAPQPFYLLYDSGCRFCQRAVAFILTLDFMGRIIAIDGQKPEEYPAVIVGAPSTDTLSDDFHGYDGKSYYRGHLAYAQVAKRIPILWPLWPFLGVPGLNWPAAKIYRWIAENRPKFIGDLKEMPAPIVTSARPVLIACAALFAVNLGFAVKRVVNAWPFACYPPYDHRSTGAIQALVFRDENGQLHEPMMSEKLKEAFLPNRLNGLTQKIRREQDAGKRQAALDSFRVIWAKVQGVDTRGWRAFDAKIWSDPARWSEAPAELKPLE